MASVSILGSGNVGANAAFFIAEKGIENVLLYDIREGTAKGKALDIMEAAPIRKYRNRITGIDSLEEIAGSEIVVITAGTVRKPGMRREDLFEENRDLVTDLAKQVGSLAPESSVIVVTEPVDLITSVFVRESGMPRERVLGLGTILDSTRLQALIAREMGVSMEHVAALVIGRHSDAMIGLPSYCSVSGIPLPQLFSKEKIDELLERTRKAGDLIVVLAQRSSAYYAPSAALSEMVDAIHMDLGRIFPVSLQLSGEYGLEGAAVSLPAVVGKGGVRRVLTPELTEEELSRLRKSVDEVRGIVEGRKA